MDNFSRARYFRKSRSQIGIVIKNIIYCTVILYRGMSGWKGRTNQSQLSSSTSYSRQTLMISQSILNGDKMAACYHLPCFEVRRVMTVWKLLTTNYLRSARVREIYISETKTKKLKNFILLQFNFRDSALSCYYAKTKKNTKISSNFQG